MSAPIPVISPLMAGLKGVCPACGEGKLFKSFLGFVNECSLCGYNHKKADPGDGPAVFVIFIIGFTVMGAALYVEMNYAPPVYVHLLLWIPAMILGSLGLIRPLKAMLYAYQYNLRAEEGELDDDTS